MKEYGRIDTVYFSVVHQTYTLSTDTWADADPDTGFPKITVIDSAASTKVNAVSMTKMATGKFEYLYELASDAALGTWTGYVTVENGGYSDKETFRFKVAA